jgi:hypothetical protein
MRVRISFYTTCMHRREHLEVTLPANLAAAAAFPHVEFVLLNYNSPDGLDEWVRAHVLSEIRSGRVLYAHERTAKKFWMSHAKNMAARLSSGEVLCNLDADNFCGEGFVEFLDQLFSHRRCVFRLLGHSLEGRLALRREDFFTLGGYDETFRGWGYEDRDLRLRALALGLTPVDVSDPRFSRVLPHSDQMRYEHLVVGRNMNRVNCWRSHWKVAFGQITANRGEFGSGRVFINFSEEPVAL